MHQGQLAKSVDITRAVENRFRVVGAEVAGDGVVIWIVRGGVGISPNKPASTNCTGRKEEMVSESVLTDR